MMINPLILRIVLLVCIFLGGLFAIIATAGKEWQKREDIHDDFGKITYTAGLWDSCYKISHYFDSVTSCSSLNMKNSSLKGNYFFMSVESARVTNTFLVL